jgi:hypothetical protein
MQWPRGIIVRIHDAQQRYGQLCGHTQHVRVSLTGRQNSQTRIAPNQRIAYHPAHVLLYSSGPISQAGFAQQFQATLFNAAIFMMLPVNLYCTGCLPATCTSRAVSRSECCHAGAGAGACTACTALLPPPCSAELTVPICCRRRVGGQDQVNVMLYGAQIEVELSYNIECWRMLHMPWPTILCEPGPTILC